ncbi:hypothetical protein ISN76_13140 [Dyella halodurans]|uniref:HPt domain-containing protein n=1 Tax=Dyella halodurans TaxID=1920171 RepID=A0ABV9C038_9GAMM|nr:hypothetical protein [Dyella halodurans]
MSGETKKVDVLNVLDVTRDGLSKSFEIAVRARACSLADVTSALANFDAARAAVAELIETLDNIGAMSRALRVGGPDPVDLEGLSDALTEAVDTANAALARVGAA